MSRHHRRPYYGDQIHLSHELLEANDFSKHARLDKCWVELSQKLNLANHPLQFRQKGYYLFIFLCLYLSHISSTHILLCVCYGLSACHTLQPNLSLKSSYVPLLISIDLYKNLGTHSIKLSLSFILFWHCSSSFKGLKKEICFCSVWRMPSLHCGAHTALSQSQSCDRKGEDASNTQPSIDLTSTFFMLNPGGDLTSTQTTFEACFKNQKDWEVMTFRSLIS